MCFPYDCCMYCGTYCQNADGQGCACCSCVFDTDYEHFCDWCKPDDEDSEQMDYSDGSEEERS